MRPKPPPAVDLAQYQRLHAADPYASNRLLFEWLCDDERRAALYRALAGAELRIHSRKRGRGGHSDARLVTDGAAIRRILADTGHGYSNDPYAQLGGGRFMLAMDPAHNAGHALQRQIAMAAFAVSAGELRQLAALACRSAAVMSLRRGAFDLADFAEQAALRFCSDLFGFALKDYPLLEGTARIAYRGLNYINLAQHFVTEPTLIPEARAAMARLLRRTAELLDAYQRHAPQGERPDDVLPLEGTLAGFEPVLQRLALMAGHGKVNGEQRATLVVGSLAGLVGNVQASVCIAVKRFFDRGCVQTLRQAVDGAPDDRLERLLWPDVLEALAANPPVPLLPRRERASGRQFLLALGAATRGSEAGRADPLIFGGMSFGTHGCLGRHLGQGLILAAVRHVLCLPGLDERLDPLDGKPVGLVKSWAFKCDRYPLVYRSGDRFAQQTLNVAMRIKSPVKDNADALRQVIRVAAPRIDRVLREANHVHFAWFEFIDNDRQLVLHTVYDGDIAAYLLHFAEAAGDLFDQLFAHLEDAPLQPVAEDPYGFIDVIRRFNRPPAAHYLFSAYPETETATITRLERSRP